MAHDIGWFLSCNVAQGSVRKTYVKFSDEQASLKAVRSSYLDRQNSWVPLAKCETETPIKKGSPSPFIKWI